MGVVSLMVLTGWPETMQQFQDTEVVLITIGDFCDLKYQAWRLSTSAPNDLLEDKFDWDWPDSLARGLLELGLACSNTNRRAQNPTVRECIERLDRLNAIAPALSRAGEFAIHTWFTRRWWC